jgi:hypothetical protein
MKNKYSWLTGIGLLTSLGFGFLPVEKVSAQQVACNQYGQCFYMQVVCNQYGQCFQRMIPISVRRNSPSSPYSPQNNIQQPMYNCTYGACTYQQYVQDEPMRRHYQERLNQIIQDWGR